MASGATELKSLTQRKEILSHLLEEQRTLAERARTDVESGIISRTQYAKEAQSVGQIELEVLENDRAIEQSALHGRESALVQQGLAQKGGVPLMPELATRQEQMIRLDLEITRLKSENRSKAAQKSALADRVARIDELAAQLKTRPAFLATQRSLDVAFVPYTQMSGVEPGAPVYSCLFGLFLCKDVGRVSDVVPGEVAMTDPWGNPARGLYAVLSLTDRESAKSKTLRVRATQSPLSKDGSDDERTQLSRR
jgi:hypothetical protein